MTCFAAWAAMRPRVSAGRSISIASPSLASGRIRRASSREISRPGSWGFSAARLTAKTRSSPFSGLKWIWTSSLREKNLAEATLRDSSMAWTMMRGSTSRSLLSWRIVFQTLTFIGRSLYGRRRDPGTTDYIGNLAKVQRASSGGLRSCNVLILGSTASCPGASPGEAAPAGSEPWERPSEARRRGSEPRCWEISWRKRGHVPRYMSPFSQPRLLGAFLGPEGSLPPGPPALSRNRLPPRAKWGGATRLLSWSVPAGFSRRARRGGCKGRCR